MPTSRTVVVLGATGRFAGLVELLLGHGHRVRAATRAPDSAAAARLRELGAEVVYGDFDQPVSIERAAAGADAMFATGTAHRVGPDGELRHGLGVAAAASAAGVPHLVYSSGDGAAAGSPVPLFGAKFAVEERIRSLGVPHTILAPVYLMENLFNPWNIEALKNGVLPSPIGVSAPMQQVAIADVIAVAGLAIDRPAEFSGRRIVVASDELSAIDAAQAVSDVVGVNLEPRQLRADQLPPGLGALFSWLEHNPRPSDITALRRRYSELSWHSYREWLETSRPRLPFAVTGPSPSAKPSR